MAQQGTRQSLPSPPPPPLQDGPYDQDEGYYAPPGPVFHIGEHATSVTVHVHTHMAEPSVSPVSYPPHASAQHASVTMEVDMDMAPAPSSRGTASTASRGSGTASTASRGSGTASTASRGSGTASTASHEHGGPNVSETTPRTEGTRSSRDVLSALPEGLLSPTMQSVLHQVLGGTVENTLAGASNEAPASATRPNATASAGRDVSISLMIRPLSVGGGTSLSDLLQQWRQEGDTDGREGRRRGGVPLAEMNRHTELMTYARDNSLHDTCGVCQETMTSGQVVRKVLRCGHTFHSTCVDQWLEANDTCPMCMQPVVRRTAEADGVPTTTLPSSLQPQPPTPPPPPSPPPPPPPRTSRARAFSPQTTVVVEQANALLADDTPHTTIRTFAPEAPEVHIQSATRRMRIPIRGATMTGANAETRPRPRMTPEAVLESALNELTLDTIDEVDGYDDTEEV